MKNPPLLIKAYLAFTRIAAPVWKLALGVRVRQGKADPARLLESRSTCSAGRVASGLAGGLCPSGQRGRHTRRSRNDKITAQT